MSRCFPFPPPGYEKKTRPDDVELLTKEKHKEKKHKKDKDKDKDKKKEGKEKKDKERSKDKHKEKKDRKDKHKDKDKKKDKDGDKDKSKTSAEKRLEGIPEGHFGGRPAESFQQPWEIKDPKSAGVLGRYIGDEERRTENQMVETFNGNDKWRTDGISRVAEKDFERRGEADKKMYNKQPDGQRKMDVEGWTGGATVQNFTRSDQKGMGKDNSVDKKGHDRKGVGQRNFDGKAITGNTVIQNFTTGINEKRIEGVARLIDKDAEKVKEKSIGNAVVHNFTTGINEKRIEGVARFTDKDAEKVKKSKSKGSDDKHKKREKKSKVKEKDRDKEKEKNKEKEKLKEKGDPSNNKQDKTIGSVKEVADSLKPPLLPKDINNGTSMEGSSRKRKEPEANGFLHENESRPNKLLKPVLPIYPPVENGRKLQPSQIAIQSAPDIRQGASNNLKVESTQSAPDIRQGASNNLKVESKEHKVNGIAEARPTSINPTKSSLVSSHASENGVASTKPPQPHPDTKFLSQILSIPKMEEWSDFDDQDWLFGENIQLKKPRDVSSGFEERPQVWAEAVRIESADVCALPYVIPY